MSNLVFKLLFLPETNPSPHEVNCTTIDISENVLSFSIDPIQLIDKDTLMMSERKASIVVANLKDYFDQYAFSLEEQIETTYHNYGSNVVEYDLSHDGETTTDRPIMFMVPFFNIETGNTNYLNGRMIFPASYNPGEDNDATIPPSISFAPIRYWYEEPYNSYTDEYIIEKPIFFSVLLDIYENNILIFRGVCTIDSYQYSYKDNKLSLAFTDANGIAIRLFDNLKNIQTYFQNVFNSGIMLSDMGTVLHDTFRKIYPQFDNLFYIPRKMILPGQDIRILELQYTFEIGSGEGTPDEPLPIDMPTNHIISITDTINSQYIYPNVVISTEPVSTKYRRMFSDGANNLVNYMPTFFIVCINRVDSNVITITAIEGFNYQSEYRIVGKIIRIKIDKVYGSLTKIVYNIDQYFSDESDYEDYYENITSNNIILINDFNYYDTMNGPTDDLLIRTTYSEGATISFDNSSSVGKNPKEDEIEDIFALCNDEGFNVNPDTKDAIKVYLLSNLLAMYTVGNSMVLKPFIFNTEYTHEIDSYYIVDLQSKKEYYERPNLDVIESVTDWFNKKIKDKIEKAINFMDEVMATRYNISIASSNFNNYLDVGSVVRFTGMQEFSDGYLDILVDKIEIDELQVRLEGYGI